MSLAGVTFVNESNYSSDVGAPASISPAQDSDICSLLLPREHPPIVEHVLFSIKFAINLFGLFSNFMVVYVYALKRDKHPSEHLICSLGFIDVFLSLMSLVFMSSVAVYKRQSDESEFFCRLVVCTLNASAFIFSTYSSGFLICVVTINRYVAICHPYDYRTIFTSGRVRNLILGGYLFGLLNSTMAIPFCNCSSESIRNSVDVFYNLTRCIVIFGNAVVMIWAYKKIMQEINRCAKKPNTEVTTLFPFNGKQPATRTCSNSSEVAYMSATHSCKTSQMDLRNGQTASINGNVGGAGVMGHGGTGTNGTSNQQQVSFNFVGGNHAQFHPEQNITGLNSEMPTAAQTYHAETNVDVHHVNIPALQSNNNNINNNNSNNINANNNSGNNYSNYHHKMSSRDESAHPRFAKFSTASSTLSPSYPNTPGYTPCSSLISRTQLRNSIRSSSSKANRKLTKTLFLVSLLFLVCHIPVVTLDLYQLVSQVFGFTIPAKWTKVVVIAHEVVYTFYLAYYDLNPIIYFACNMYFRTNVMTMFKYCATSPE